MMLVSAFLALAHGMHLWTLSFGDNAIYLVRARYQQPTRTTLLLS
jgi:hypothetical protein